MPTPAVPVITGPASGTTHSGSVTFTFAVSTAPADPHQSSAVLLDSFDDNALHARWTALGTVSESNGRLNLTVAAANANSTIYNTTARSLEGADAYIQLVDTSAVTTVAQSFLWSDNAAALVGIQRAGANLRIFYHNSGAGTVFTVHHSVAYDATNHVWFRIRHDAAGGVYRFYVATLTGNWQELPSLTASLSNLARGTAYLQPQLTSDGAHTGTVTVSFDNLYST